MVEPENVGDILTQRSTPNGSYNVLMPGSTGQRFGGKISVNLAGYRGKRYPVERDAAVRRIMIFGDSHAAGVGVDDDATYPTVVGKLLLDEIRVQVLNFGVGGHDLQQIVSYIRDSTPIYNPDYVILTFHAGDLITSDFFLYKKNKIKPQSTGLLYSLKQYTMASSYLARFIIPYGASYWRLIIGRTSGITDLEYEVVRRDGVEWKAAKDEILKLRNFLEYMNIELMFVLFPSMTNFENHPAKELHQILEAWFKSNDIKSLDLIPYYRSYDASKLRATLLDKHPNELGYGIAGRAVAKWLQEVLL